VGPSSLFTGQVAKRVDKAVSQIEGLREAKIGHVSGVNTCCQSATAKLSLSLPHTARVQIKRCD
jgi:hypothetical protein